MKNCPYCKIKIGGDLKKCPVCQSKLLGEADAPYFPKQTTLHLRSFLYKLQLFIVWIIVIAAFGIDFLFDVKIPPFVTVHWSLILAMWLIVFEFGIMRQFKKGTGSARKVTMMVFIILFLLFVTAYYFGFLRLTLDWITPCVITGTMIANFVLAMVDKRGNAMVYLLTNLLVGVLPYIMIHFNNREVPTTWIICMLMSVILFVGAVIFKGRSVAAEIRRRLSL
jgi:hypothetical protein